MDSNPAYSHCPSLATLPTLSTVLLCHIRGNEKSNTKQNKTKNRQAEASHWQRVTSPVDQQTQIVNLTVHCANTCSTNYVLFHYCIFPLPLYPHRIFSFASVTGRGRRKEVGGGIALSLNECELSYLNLRVNSITCFNLVFPDFWRPLEAVVPLAFAYTAHCKGQPCCQVSHTHRKWWELPHCAVYVAWDIVLT